MRLSVSCMPSTGINSKLRIHLATDNSTLRKFYWFKLVENDLYWGSSSDSKEAFCTIPRKTSNSFTIQTPKDFKELDVSRTKYSFHASGQFHLQRLENGKYQGTKLNTLWNKKEDINKPQRIFSLLSKPLFDYPEETKEPTSKGYYSKAILLEGEAGHNRLFMEFFLSPLGEYINPTALFEFGSDKQIFIPHGLSSNLILLIRFTKLTNIENWHPDKEIIFLEEFLENE